jgi:hypothetical protein
MEEMLCSGTTLWNAQVEEKLVQFASNCGQDYDFGDGVLIDDNVPIQWWKKQDNMNKLAFKVVYHIDSSD